MYHGRVALYSAGYTKHNYQFPGIPVVISVFYPRVHVGTLCAYKAHDTNIVELYYLHVQVL